MQLASFLSGGTLKGPRSLLQASPALVTSLTLPLCRQSTSSPQPLLNLLLLLQLPWSDHPGPNHRLDPPSGRRFLTPPTAGELCFRPSSQGVLWQTPLPITARPPLWVAGEQQQAG